MRRRDVLTGVLGAGTASHMATGSRGAGDTDDDAETNALLRDILQQMRGGCPSACSEVDLVRSAQRTFRRASGKYPDYVEVGIDIWDRVHDWMRQFNQPVDMSRTGDGRYALRFEFTMLLLRHDMPGNYIGTGFDNK
jgi:hypothetical protein